MGNSFCSDCGENLDGLSDDSSENKVPCPKCGSTRRTFNVHVQEEIKLGDHVSAVGKRNKKTIGFRESERKGRAASADRNNDDSLTYSGSSEFSVKSSWRWPIENPFPQQIEVRTAVQHALDQFQPIHVSFNLAGAPNR